MNLRFGIQEKTGVLVMAVAVTVALGTALFLQRISARAVEEHEMVDLSDESQLRGWDLIDAVSTYRAEIGQLAADSNVQQAVYEGHPEVIARKGAKSCARWNDFLAVQVLNSFGEELSEPAVRKIRGLDDSEQIALLSVAEREERDIPLTSELVRSEAEILIPGPDEDSDQVWRHKWLALLWGCVRVRPPADWQGDARYLTFTMALEPYRSPRHLFFLVDYEAPGQPFIMHPNMSISRGLGRDGMFDKDFRSEIEEKREYSEIDAETKMVRVTLLKQQELRPEYYFYFQEGKPTELLTEALARKRAEDPVELVRFFELLNGRHESMDRQIGGLDTQVKDFRLLGRDPADFERREASSLIRMVEQDLRDYAGLGPRRKVIEWKKLLECRHCHIICVDLFIPAGVDTRRYMLMYAAFQEEFTGAIRYEIKSRMLVWSLLFGLMGLMVAMGATLYFVRPLRQMTQTAQHIVAEEGALHERLAELADSLPTSRGDEVGDIARASQRLFQEISLSHEKLEERVRARTAQLQAANEQLEGLAKEKDAFLANVSHELRTPLTAVSGFLQLLQRKLDRDKPLGDREKEYVAKSLAASSHLETLIDDILDFQKIVMGGITLDPVTFRVGDFLMELRESLQFQAKKNDNKLDFSWDHRLFEMETDRHRLRQVLTNLVSNACKFTKQGVVRLEAKRFERDGEGWLRFRVIDSGRGMTKLEQSRLFTRFFTSRKSNQSGTGLGLVISEGLCRLMGGKVYLETSVIDRGSTFAVEIPMKAPPQKILHQDEFEEDADELDEEDELTAPAEDEEELGRDAEP